jgi:hypothetical protein
MRKLLSILGAIGVAASATAAQTPTAQILYACYVPSTGTVYRIREPGLPSECSGARNGFGMLRRQERSQHARHVQLECAGTHRRNRTSRPSGSAGA